ncbi:MAG: universal stress protein [Anaerolineae bacterium]|nr:universal stress protein [Anaerolineae bacterium]
MVGKILCPTRGGEASYCTQDAAIALAKERDDELVFLYIVDTSFLRHTSRAVRPDVVAEEMARMGAFLLAMAQERAAAQGVKAETLIRRGNFKEELTRAIEEEAADVLILGKPGGEESAFRLDTLQELAAKVVEGTTCSARIVEYP